MTDIVEVDDQQLVSSDAREWQTVEIISAGPPGPVGPNVPASDGDRALGAPGIGWADLYLSYAAKIDYGNGDLILQHSDHKLTFTGGSNGYAFDALVVPTANDVGALGTPTESWSDLYLASGGVINWNNGTLTLTESSGTALWDGVDHYFRRNGDYPSIITTRMDVAGDGSTIGSWALNGKDSAGTTKTYARIFGVANATTPGAETGTIEYYVMKAGTFTNIARLNSAGWIPGSNDVASLGTATNSWADLFLASGGVINWNNGDVTLTHAANALAFAGASSGYSFDALVKPATNDGGALGTGALSWSDLFLASGGVINWNNGDIKIYENATDSLTVESNGPISYFRIYNTLSQANLQLDGVNYGQLQNVAGDLYISNSSATGDIIFRAGADTERWRIDETGKLYPGADNSYQIGTTTRGISDLFLGSGAVIDFNAGNMRLVHYANSLSLVSDAATVGPVKVLDIVCGDTGSSTSEARITFSLGGAQTHYGGVGMRYFNGGERYMDFACNTTANSWNSLVRLTSTGILYPTTNDGVSLGKSGNGYSDLFLASGAVIDFNAGDITLTHSSDSLNMAGGYFYVLNGNSPTAPAIYARNTANSDTLKILELGAFRTGTAAANDSGYINFTVKNSAGSNESVAYLGWRATDVTDTSEDAEFYFSLASAGTVGGSYLMAPTNFRPASNDGASLGISGTAFSDLFLASGAVINFNAGDVTITHSANALAIAGATNGYSFDAVVKPATNDGAALGTTALMWSDLFLASGGVINFNNGNITLTHSAGVLTLAGGTLNLPSSGLKINGLVFASADPNVDALYGWDDSASTYTNLSAADATAILNAFVGDAGSGGTKGLVPAPASGDATKFLKGNGAWEAIPGGGDALTANPLSQFAATTSAQLAGVISDETGSGALVFATSPTLVTPVLGTPSSGTLTNCTGLPVGSGISGLGSGIATFLATPSSANLRSALTDETGTGVVVFSNAPALTSPAITTKINPVSDDGASLGEAGIGWSDAYFASGGDLNFNSGNFILGHVAGALEVKAGTYIFAGSASPHSSNIVGFSISKDGFFAATRDGGQAGEFNRKTSDGTIVNFRQDGTIEGAVTVAGTTLTYATFCGSHFSQLSDGGILDIKRGTVIETIDAVCSWPGEENDQLPKFKVSDTPGSSRVYGVFLAWDADDMDSNDAIIASLGTYLVRIAAGETVQGGDLIESNGTGCGRVQADDIIRSSTVGKVTSDHVVETFSDGSYLVPCVLYCG